MTVSNLAIAWVNIFDNATLAASSEAANMLVTKLQQEDTRRNFRTGAVTTVNIDLTYAATQSADTFALVNTNLSAAGIVRIKLSNVSLGGTDIWDSNPSDTAGTVDPSYKDAIVLASSVKSGWKYCRIILTDTSKTYLEAGRGFIGTRSQFDINFNFGAQFTVVDPSIHKKTKGGQTKIMVRPKFRQFDLPVGFVTEAQRRSIVDGVDLVNGISTPVLVMTDPSSTNMGRDSLYGLIKESSPVQIIEGFDSVGGIMSSKSYRIEQRL